MRPSSVYPQLPHFHIHGVATSIPSKEKFEVRFLLKYFQNLKVKRRSWKNDKEKRNKKKKLRKKRAPKVS
jgi:hypothetical protein